MVSLTCSALPSVHVYFPVIVPAWTPPKGINIPPSASAKDTAIRRELHIGHLPRDRSTRPRAPRATSLGHLVSIGQDETKVIGNRDRIRIAAAGSCFVAQGSCGRRPIVSFVHQPQIHKPLGKASAKYRRRTQPPVNLGNLRAKGTIDKIGKQVRKAKNNLERRLPGLAGHSFLSLDEEQVIASAPCRSPLFTFRATISCQAGCATSSWSARCVSAWSTAA
jgi:hypothetical protein